VKPPTGSERDSKELELAIVRSREEISKTLEALHHQLNPRVMKDDVLKQLHEGKEALKADLHAELHEAKALLGAEYRELKDQVSAEVKTELSSAQAAFRDAVVGKVEDMVQSTRESVSSAGRALVNTVKENPIPAALVGVGLVWMLTNSLSRSRSKSSGLSKVVRQATQAVSEAAQTTGERLGDAATRVKESADEAAEAASHEISHLAHAAGETGERVGRRAGEFFTENPLAVGAAVLAAGALVGMAIPITHKEKEWLGDARGDLADKAERLAHKVETELHEGVSRAESV